MHVIDTVRNWVYAASVKGRFQIWHRWSGVVLQAVLFLTPWIVVAGHPAFQIDIEGRRLYALGGVFTPTDTILLVLMGLFTAFGLFLFTAIYGRLWCGYACPQTVFLEEWVRPIELWLEGERGVRMARDKGPWTFDKTWRKLAKWTAFLAISIVVSMSFVSWFAGARALWTGAAEGWYYWVTAFFTALMFWDLAWFREQFCNFLCPYARFQGVLCDDASLVVSYDAARGEPRGTEGACIDCKKCVAVCPQGIDIRTGFQLECISCARCVDACQIVMDKKGQPNLITYNTLSGEQRIVRPRTVAYTTLLTVIAVGFFTVLFTRPTVDGLVSRTPGSTYTVDADGYIRNTYLLRLTSHQNEARTWAVKIDGLPADAQVIVPPITLDGAATTTVPLVVRVPAAELTAQSVPMQVVVDSGNGTLSMKATFLSAGG
ncbi:MAG: cytochrome c oxidase accessory protein CcoG [Gemmatimonadota bacterium]|nr:cytochrome c oxidase accessory protein CcoG [Gemmatimonadota bacterium]